MFMRHRLPHSVMNGQPLSVGEFGYLMRMAFNSKKRLVENVRAMLSIRDGQSGVSDVMRLGFANGTAQRILDDTEIRLGTLDQLAEKLKTSPWQLLAPAGAASLQSPFSDEVTRALANDPELTAMLEGLARKSLPLGGAETAQHAKTARAA